MKVYTIINRYNDGYEEFDKTGNGSTFNSQEVAERALQYLLDNELGQDDGDFGSYSCFIWERNVYSDLETWLED